MFAPATMRIHPIFTRVKDWSGDNIPDGIDALIEFQDQFGDPTKAAGTAVFHLYQFEKFAPERRGQLVANPWIGTLLTEADQRDRWNRTSRTYTFPLSFAGLRAEQTYVLTCQFNLSGGGRFFDQLVLEPAYGAYTPKEQRNVPPATAPATQSGFGGFGPPASQPATQPAAPGA